MKINAINNQNFEAKKFRLPLKIVKDTESVKANITYASKQTDLPGVYVMEYSNPLAKDLYEKAMNTKNLEEKLNLLEKMGDYKVIDIAEEQKIEKFLDIKL